MSNLPSDPLTLMDGPGRPLQVAYFNLVYNDVLGRSQESPLAASCIDPTKTEYCSCRREVFGVDPPPQQATSPPTVIGSPGLSKCSSRVLSWFLQLIRSTPANILGSTSS
ncbi:hypothetical protein TNCV_1262871 [Trichonephila clavipes]|nr:hypothetical protein TNCV_1262871 [Trichonephila clavipes]